MGALIESHWTGPNRAFGAHGRDMALTETELDRIREAVQSEIDSAMTTIQAIMRQEMLPIRRALSARGCRARLGPGTMRAIRAAVAEKHPQLREQAERQAFLMVARDPGLGPKP